MCFTYLQCFSNRELTTFLNFLLRNVTRNTEKKKSSNAIKQELLASIMKIANEGDYSGMSDEVKIRRDSQKRK